MQIDTLLPFRTICQSTHHDHFVPYAKSYEDSTFILILHHIQITVIPKYMLHVGTVKSMYLRYTCIFIIWSRHCLDASTAFLSGQCVYI
jgi:hypothetical protein